MSGRIDLHCHLLPAIDDGPRDEQESVALARALVADGVTTVAATPHRTPQLATPPFELEARLAGLRSLLQAEQIPLTVISGSEVAVDALLDLDEAAISALRLGGTGPLLVELPQRELPGDPSWIVTDLLQRGIPVLLAHPERIPLLQQQPARLQELIAAGARTQLTAGSLLGRYGRTAQQMSIAMLDAGLVDVLASDAHHAELRPPELTAAQQWLHTYHPQTNFDDLAVHTPEVLIPRQTAAT